MLIRTLVLIVSLTALPSAVHAGPFMFGRAVWLANADSGAVAVADFNGDGLDDLAVGRPWHVDVMLQRGDGSLAPATKLSVPATAVYDLLAVDLGNDGTWQLLVGHNRGLSVYNWNSAGTVTLVSPVASEVCGSMASADLDGDGLVDVFCMGGGMGALYFSSSSGVLSAPTYMQPGGAGVPRLKDVTGDGKPDLLVAEGNSFYVHPHDGGRGFLPAVAYTYPGDRPLRYMEVMEHAGVDEVIIPASCNTPCATIYKYRRAASGYFQLWESHPTLDIPAGSLVTDIDGDTREDLLVGHLGQWTIGRYMGVGSRLSSAELWSTAPVNAYFHALAAGDLNHDGHKDLAVASESQLHVLYGGRQKVSDMDGDFSSDLVWLNQSGESMAWPSANSAAQRPLEVQDANWLIQAVGDFDGDGSADTFWRNQSTGANEVSSAGQSRLTSTPTVASQDWQVVGAGDFDGDSRTDLLWRNSRTGANTIWKSATSETYQALAVAELGWKVAGIGDFNRDGRSDIMWRNASTGANVLWPSSRRDLQQTLTSVASQQWQVAGVGDFNGDGADDLVWRNGATGANELWYSASSARRILIAAMPVNTTLAAVGDYNGDGRADLMWRNASTGENVIWRSADKNQLQPVGSLAGWKVVR